MGILDDAIREHLELKRQHGAESDDLERLENEAFGPATRPGDPEFDTGAEAAVPAAPTEDPGPAGEAPPAEEPAEAPSSGSTSDWLADDGEETTVAPQTDSAPMPSAEAARAEHPQLGDTADHPAPDPLPEPAAEAAPELEEPAPLAEPLPPEPAAEEPVSEEVASEPPEAPESSIFDGGDLDFGDLELEEEDDGTVGRQPGGEEESPFVTDEEDLSLAFEDEVPPTGEAALPPRDEVLRDVAVEEDTGNPPLPIPPAEEPEDALEEPLPPAEDDAEGEGEDLLEETPDFLRDTPEGDQAWFEQDPPKDFDFDD